MDGNDERFSRVSFVIFLRDCYFRLLPGFALNLCVLFTGYIHSRSGSRNYYAGVLVWGGSRGAEGGFCRVLVFRLRNVIGDKGYSCVNV